VVQLVFWSCSDGSAFGVVWYFQAAASSAGNLTPDREAFGDLGSPSGSRLSRMPVGAEKCAETPPNADKETVGHGRNRLLKKKAFQIAPFTAVGWAEESSRLDCSDTSTAGGLPRASSSR